jgi:hypothetical protein
MTASKTPRLGLMNPVGSDAFVVQDFTATMAILDANPGVPIVANAAARPTSYTQAQHGSQIYQADYGIVWVWHQPTSSAGFWRRVGNVGLISQFSTSATTSTTTTNYALGPVVVSGDVTIPGGRPYKIDMSWDSLGNTYQKSVVSFWEGNTRIFDRVFYGSLPAAASGGGTWFTRPAPSSAFTFTAKMTIASFNATAPNGSGTTTIIGPSLAITEV